MKKIKFLSVISSLPLLAMASAPLSSCSKKAETKETCTISIEAGEHGTVSINSLNVEKGSTWGSVKSKITVTFDNGYHFKQWEKDGTVLEDSFVINQNFSVKAIFEINTYKVSTDSSSQEVIFSGKPESIQHGTDIDFTYTYDYTLQINETESDIVVGSKSIKDKDWVKYKDGTIHIPAFLITDNVFVKIIAEYKSYHLNQKWAEIVNACFIYENSSHTEADKNKFIASFSAKDKTISTMDDLVGCWTTLKINNKQHIVRIIGVDHDTISNSSTKAALTFELVTLLSDANGNTITSKWDTTNSFDYANSILMKNLNGPDDQASWGDGTVEDKRTVLQMLPFELTAGGVIKSVTKTVATSTDSGATFTATNYDAKLFPLTYSEMGQTHSESSHWLAEGSVYKYWDINKGGDSKIKYDASGKKQYYWLTTPQTNDTNYVGYVSDQGLINFTNVYTPRSVSFGFCI